MCTEGDRAWDCAGRCMPCVPGQREGSMEGKRHDVQPAKHYAPPPLFLSKERKERIS